MTERHIRPAWRAYRLFRRGELCGAHGTHWPGPVLRAECRVCREVPGWDCACGVYGAYDPVEAAKYGDILALARPFGRVVPHSDGWRAEWAQVLAVYVPPDLELPPSWADCERLSIHDVLEAVARAHGWPLCLDEAMLTGAVLPGADLSGAQLWGAVLFRADLGGADLRDAVLLRADLGGADLRDAVLLRADLRNADLSGADLRGATLRGANLRRADLRGADCRGADFRGALTEHADFRGALTEGTRGLQA